MLLLVLSCETLLLVQVSEAFFNLSLFSPSAVLQSVISRKKNSTLYFMSALSLSLCCKSIQEESENALQTETQAHRGTLQVVHNAKKLGYNALEMSGGR